MSDADSVGRLTPYARRVLIALGFTTAMIVVLFIVWRIGQALLVIFASCLFAVFLAGCSRWLAERTRLTYGLCLFLIILAMIAAISGTATFLGVRLAQQATQLFQGLIDTLQDARDWVQQFEWGEQLLEQAEDGQLQLSEVTAPAMRMLKNAFGGVTIIVLILVIGLYLAGSPRLYQRGILRLVPMAQRDRARELLIALGRALQGWLLAQFVSMALIGTLVAIGLWLFGIELWLILGLLAGTLTFIPNLGPIIAAIPPVLLALNESFWLAVGVLVYFTAVQLLEGYFVTPMIQHRVIRLPPAAILSIQLLMAYAFGILGVAVAAPLLVVVMVVVEMLYVQDLLGDRNLRITGQEGHLW